MGGGGGGAGGGVLYAAGRTIPAGSYPIVVGDGGRNGLQSAQTLYQSLMGGSTSAFGATIHGGGPGLTRSVAWSTHVRTNMANGGGGNDATAGESATATSSSGSKNIYEFPVVASFYDSNELYYGRILNSNEGTGTIAVENKKTGVKCSGNAWVTSTPPHVLALQKKGELVCEGQEGAANLSCSDGRKLITKYHMEDCGTGWGTGEDNYGAKFHFVFGLSE